MIFMKRQEYNIKTDLREIGCETSGLFSTGSPYGQTAGICDHTNEPSDSIKYGSG
jgi:hypothetical protein